MKWISFLVLAAFSLTTEAAGAVESESAAKAVDQQQDSSRQSGLRRQYPPQLDDAEVMVYKTVDGVELNMYIFTPEGHSQADKRPAIVFFFGGGWRGGSPAQFAEQCRYFASRGMIAITVDYRVLSRHGTRAVACVADAKSAFRWARTHASELGVDPNRIAAGGGSAGGHIAACAGVVPGMEEPGEDTTVSSRPNALVLFNPPLALAPIDGEHPLGEKAATIKERVGDDPQKISPYHHVKAGQPPTIIFFGTDDMLLKGARHFAEASTKAGNRCELLTWEGLKHGFFNYGRDDNKPFEETIQAADQFLASLGYLEGEPTISANKE